MVKSQKPALPVEVAPPLPTANPPLTLFTYAEVAKLCRVGKQTVYEWVKTGRVPSPLYTGATARFTEEHVNVILHDRKRPGSYTVQPSPRAEVGKLGQVARKLKAEKAERKRKRPKSVFVLTDLVPPVGKTKDRVKNRPTGKPTHKQLPGKTRTRKAVRS